MYYVHQTKRKEIWWWIWLHLLEN